MTAQTTPWYVDVFLAIGGWIAGLFLSLAIFTFAFAVFSGGGVAVAWLALFAGLGFVAAGVSVGRRAGSFNRHFGVAIVGAGLTAFAGGLGWILARAVGEKNAQIVGVCVLIVSAAQAGVAWLASRALKDPILSFLATLAWFGLAATGFYLVFPHTDAAAATSVLVFVAAAAAVGAALFIGVGATHLPVVGAALMLAPIVAGEVLRHFLGMTGADVRAAALPANVLYLAATAFALARLAPRANRFALVAAGGVALAAVFLLPISGAAAVLALVAGMAAQSRALAAIGVVALAWFVARFYDDLSMTLLQKSALLGGLGLAAVAVAEGLRRVGRDQSPTAHPSSPRARRSFGAVVLFGLVLAASATLSTRAALRLEREFREAETIYLPLAPVDPRSILQGDYMTLRFDSALFPEPGIEIERHGEVFFALDARGVARFSRLAASGDAPRPDEIRVDYVERAGKPRYCPESFFFQEGEADAFSQARFAVLRVAADGKTRLVALADGDVKQIDPAAGSKRD